MDPRSKLQHSVRIQSDEPASKRTDLTQLQALLASTIPSKILEIGTTNTYYSEECSSIHRGTSWEQNDDTTAPLPNYSLTLVEVQNGEERRRPAPLLSTSTLSLS